MQQHNLYSPNGAKLNYPHYTKWDTKNNVGLVTDPKKKISKGDIVFVALESTNSEGEIVYNYLINPHTVLNVTETRMAKGNHVVEFNPIFQSLSVKLIPKEK